MPPELSCFISPHGYGHATRIIAILEALHRFGIDLRVQMFTTVPQRLFDSCPFPVCYHRVVTDVGLAQDNAFQLNLPDTVTRLSHLLPFSQKVIEDCAAQCHRSAVIVCDISPLGILVGKQLGIPSVLLENFTWDWIYHHLADGCKDLLPFAELFSDYYRNADVRIQSEPVCRPVADAITCPPVARHCRVAREHTVEQLGSSGRPVVLVSMGGIPLELPFLEQLAHFPEYFFVLAGQPANDHLGENVRRLSFDYPLGHPDLINGADLLVCKAGYSTIAECCQTKTSICCVTRNDFAESGILDDYVQRVMNGTVIEPQQLLDGSWLSRLPDMINRRRSALPANGADRAGAVLAAMIR